MAKAKQETKVEDADVITPSAALNPKEELRAAYLALADVNAGLRKDPRLARLCDAIEVALKQ